MFGVAAAYGLFVRHAKNITIDDVEFNILEPDHRPGLLFDDVSGIDLRNVTVQRTDDSNAIILKNVTNCTILQSRGIEDQKISFVKEKKF
jgi:hypothetical protein